MYIVIYKIIAATASEFYKMSWVAILQRAFNLQRCIKEVDAPGQDERRRERAKRESLALS